MCRRLGYGGIVWRGGRDGSLVQLFCSAGRNQSNDLLMMAESVSIDAIFYWL